MKRFGFLVVAVLVLFAGSVHAVDQAVKEHQFFARVTNPEQRLDNFKISPGDYPKGVYILVEVGCIWCKKTKLDKVEAIYAERLKAHGVKIAAKREEADVLIRVGTVGVDPAEIQDGKNDNWKRGLSLADDLIGFAAGAKISGGVSIITNGLPDLKLSKKQIGVAVQILDPITEKQHKLGMVMMTAEYSEDTPVVSAALIALGMDEWVKQYVKAVLAPSVSSVSAVPAAASLATAGRN